MSRTLHPGSSPLKSRKLRALGTSQTICSHLPSLPAASSNTPVSVKLLGNGLYEVPVLGLSARLRSNCGVGMYAAPDSGSSRGNAAYVDGNGRWWDESYSLCRVAPVVHSKVHVSSDGEASQPTQDRQLLSVVQSNAIPQPHEFGSYREYEMALIRWKEVMESALHSAEILLPSPQGRFHYRPPFNPNRTFNRLISLFSPSLPSIQLCFLPCATHFISPSRERSSVCYGNPFGTFLVSIEHISLNTLSGADFHVIFVSSLQIVIHLPLCQRWKGPPKRRQARLPLLPLPLILALRFPLLRLDWNA